MLSIVKLFGELHMQQSHTVSVTKVRILRLGVVALPTNPVMSRSE